jgi:hypothetical protein
MRAIGPLVGLDLEEVGRRLLEGAPMDVGHNVGGNALRMTGAISLKPNFDWRTKLTPESERTFWRIGGWLERRYGYER